MSLRKFALKTLLMATVVGLGAVAVAGNANAIAFTGPGPSPVEDDTLFFKFLGYTKGTGAFTDTSGSAGAETTWGVGTLTNIYVNGSILPSWSSGGSDGFVDFYLWGISDKNFTPGAPGTLNNIGATSGCTATFACDGKIHVDFYQNPVSGVPLADGNDRATSEAAITAAPGGSLLMRWELVPGYYDVGDPNADVTLVQLVGANALPTTGSGSFLADCVSGDFCGLLADKQFELNDFTPDRLGDLLGNFTLFNTSLVQNFDGRINDPVEGVVAAPEPGTLALLGTGLLGLLGFGRSRRRKS
jgi:PEP-CTERM motif